MRTLTAGQSLSSPRTRSALLLPAMLVLAVATGLLASPANSAATAARPVPVLGAKQFAPYGEGFGTARPRAIHNGGSPGGSAFDLRWRRWGGPRAVGRGKMPLYRPTGGYYRRPGKVVFRAQRLGTCGEGRRAYTRLYYRAARRPGGPVAKRWRPWTYRSGNICRF